MYGKRRRDLLAVHPNFEARLLSEEKEIGFGVLVASVLQGTKLCVAKGKGGISNANMVPK